MTVLVILLTLAVGVLAVIVFGLLRTHAEILRALNRAGISLDDDSAAVSDTRTRHAQAPAPSERGGAHDTERGEAHDIVGVSPAGGPSKVGVANTVHLTLLAFLSSGCRSCAEFWQAFSEPGLALPGDGTRLVIVGEDPIHDSESAFAALVPPGVKAVLSSAAWQDYDVPGSPYFVLVDGSANRVVGAGSAVNWDQIRGLLTQALDDAGIADRRKRSGRASRRIRRSTSGRLRSQRADEALLSVGIEPGHPSLYSRDTALHDSDENIPEQPES